MLPIPNPGLRSSRPRLAGLVAGLALLWTCAWAFLLFAHAPVQRQRLRATWQERLSSLAEDRARGVAESIATAEGDARLVGRFPSVVSLLLGSPKDATAVAHVVEVLETVVEAHGYRAVEVLDSRGATLAVAPPGIALPQAVLPTNAPNDRTRAVIEGSVETGGPLLSIVTPTIWSGRSPRGFVRIAVDPTRHIFPLLANSPFSMATGETLLVRADSGRLTILSPAHRESTGSLSSTIPSDQSPLVALEAGGVQPFAEYADQSGRSLLAASHTVPGVDWVIISSIESREAMEPYHRSLAGTASWLTALLTIATLALVGAWRAWNRKMDAATQRWASFVTAIMEQASDAVLVLDTDGRIRNVNARAERLYGWTREELVRQSIADLEASPLSSLDEELRHSDKEPGELFVTTHRNRQGALFVAEVSTRVVQTDEGPVVVQIVRDISERRRLGQKRASCEPREARVDSGRLEPPPDEAR